MQKSLIVEDPVKSKRIYTAKLAAEGFRVEKVRAMWAGASEAG